MALVLEKRKMTKLQRQENLVGWLFVAVPLIGTAVFTVLPVLMSLYLSFTQWRGFTPIWQAEWVGLSNFREILFGSYQSEFFGSILNTLFMVLSLPITLFFSLLVAILLNRTLPGAGVFRVVYYIPALSTAVVVVLIFQNLFAEQGLINQFLALLHIQGPMWLNQKGYATVVIIVLSLWKNLGGNMLMFLAGLQSISKDYNEAAMLDGANSCQIFLKITLPLLKPMTFFMLVTGLMGGLQAFNEPFLMFPYNFGYGPESSTETVMVFMYYQFSNNNALGMASAISWLLAIIIFIVTMVQFWYNKRSEKDY